MPKLHPSKPKQKSLFLGQRISKIKPSDELPCRARFSVSKNPKKAFQVCALLGGTDQWVVDTVHNLFVGVGVGLPCTVMECGDIIYRSTLPKSSGLTITAPGVVLALGALSYLWATPGVAPGFFDMFVLAFVERLFRPTYKKVCFLRNFCKILFVEHFILFFPYYWRVFFILVAG